MNKQAIGFTGLMFIHCAARAFASDDTGYTTCYDAAGSAVSCTSATAADDGRFGRDAAQAMGHLPKVGGGLAGFDLTKIANDGSDLPPDAALGKGRKDWACTRDNATGLTWEVKSNDHNDVRYFRRTFTWYNPNPSENGGNPGHQGLNFGTCDPSRECNTSAYVAAANLSSLCGFSDWRLPTPRELRSIVNYSLSPAGSFDPVFFGGYVLTHPHYWSSVTWAANSSEAWLVEIGGEGEGDGGAEGHHHSKLDDSQILIVRGASTTGIGECKAANPRAGIQAVTPTSDFVDHGDGTVTHVSTRLMWKKCAEGLSGASCSGGSATTMMWGAALAAADSSTFAGYEDWRLPNVKELHSILELCGYDLAINMEVFPGVPRPSSNGALFWTSTTDFIDRARAWLFLFDRGGGVVSRKDSRLFVRLVRAGTPADSFDAKNPPALGRGRRRAVRH